MKRRFGSFILVAASIVTSGASCTSKAPEALPTATVESGFLLDRDAFAFANFAGPDTEARVTAETIARMFGDEGTCARRESGVCQPTELASLWIDHVNRAMNGGRCEGFTVLSALLFLRDLRSEEFGGQDPHSLSLAGNAKLASELAYWFSSQFLQSVAKDQTRALTGKEVVSFLGRTLADRSDLYRIGIVRIDANGRRTGGHSVLPYAVVPLESGRYAIKVYDNNHPGEERAIEVDTTENQWSYRASSNPDDPQALYEGTIANANKMYLAPIRPRLGMQQCPYCSGNSTEAAEALAEIFTFGSAEAAVVDAEGRSSGIVDGRVVSDAGGVTVAPSFSNTLADDAPITLFVRTGAARLELRSNGTSAPGGVTMMTPGFAAGVGDLGSSLGSVSRLFVGTSDGSVLFEPGSAGTPQLFSIRRTTAGAEVSLSVQPTAPASHTFGIALDGASGDANVLGGTNGATFTVTVVRNTPSAREPFEGVLDVPPGGSATLDLDGWPGSGAPIEGVIHVEGSPDQRVTVYPKGQQAIPRSCKEIRDAGVPPPNGKQTIDVDGPGGLAPFEVYCDFTTDGGGWTIVASYTGGDNENAVTSNVEANGDPFSFEHFNLNRAKKMALSAISTESLFKRPSAWLKASAPLFDAALDTPGSHPHVPVTITESEGLTAQAIMGYANTDISAGGDFGISTTAFGFDHTTPDAAHANNMCIDQFLYSYSGEGLDGDPGYEAGIGFGSWTVTSQMCNPSETGHMVLYFAVR